jgi:chromosome segregation ATPase
LAELRTVNPLVVGSNPTLSAMSNEHEATIRDLQSSIMRLQEEKAQLSCDVETWAKTCEKFSIEAFNAKAQLVHLKNSIDSLEMAIKDEGPYPKHHRKIMFRHKREWPTLWNAIDKVIYKSKNTGESCQS